MSTTAATGGGGDPLQFKMIHSSHHRPAAKRRISEKKPVPIMAAPNPNDQSGKSPYFMPDEFSYQFMGPPTTSASASDFQFSAATSSPGTQATDFQIRPSPAPSTQYQFITTTGEEDSATSKRKLKTVRSHVMRNFLQQQQQQRRGSGAGQTPASSPPSEYLSVEMSPEEQDRRKRSRSFETPPPGLSRKSSTASSTLEQQIWASNASYQGASSPSLSQTQSFRRGSSQSTVPSPYMQNIPIHPRPTHALRSGTWAIDFVWEPIPPDEASNYSLMHIASVLRDKMTQQPAPSMETLQVHGEAMRHVVGTLQACGKNVAQSTVFAVSNLATASVINAEWDEAKRHLEALIRIVDLRGGVTTLDFELQRIITWASYYVSTILQAPPSFPCPSFPQPRPFPLALTDDSSIRAWRTVKKLPKNSSFLYDLVLRCHQIGLATTSEFRDEVDVQAVSNAYFESQHRLLLLNVEQPWMGREGPVDRVPELEALYQVFDHATQLFLWTTIRHVHGNEDRWSLRAGAGSIRLVFQRIQAALSVEGGYSVWARRRCLDPMVWVLVVCVESCGNIMPERGWFLAELRKVLGILKVKKIEEFRKVLAAFPATDGLRAVERDVWESMARES